MSHLQCYRAIWSHNFIARQSCSMQLCMLHTARLSLKQELTNQRSPHSGNKVAQNKVMLYSERVAQLFRSCATRHITLAILSREKTVSVTSVLSSSMHSNDLELLS